MNIKELRELLDQFPGEMEILLPPTRHAYSGDSDFGAFNADHIAVGIGVKRTHNENDHVFYTEKCVDEYKQDPLWNHTAQIINERGKPAISFGKNLKK